MNDLVQEAGLGLMKAADKFDPDRGVRFSTYAVWWIKASIQDHVMRNWSLVRTGSTSAQKSLFFNLKRVEAQIMRESGETLDAHQVTEKIATEIGVSVRDVEMMQGRLAGGDFSLNAQQGGDEDGREWIDVLEDEASQGSEQVDAVRDSEVLKSWLSEALDGLNPRERLIVEQRRLADKGRTLEMIGQDLGISKERVRQLEVVALTKMRAKLEKHGAEVRALLLA
jgi:RNA polymerase sigma-32 factor